MDIARTVGATKRQNGYMEGGGYLVTWALGHLAQLALPSFYGQGRPSAGNLPLIPDPFTLTVRQVKGQKGTASDPAAVRQLKTIDEVFSRCTSIIAATDAGREGELIFRYIYSITACKLPFRRLWISSLTDQAVRRGMESLAAGSDFDNLFRAAECRAKADWLVGINASQALAVASGLGNNSLGRVQTPTLALICARYRENRGFVPSDYWQLYAVLEKDGLRRKFRYTGELPDQAQAGELHRRVRDAGTATVTRCERKPVSEAPPLLYDLTALQKECNVRLGYAPEKTLEVAQSLYEKKLLTYPRTGSRYIPEDVFATVPALLRKVCVMPEFGHVRNSVDLAALPAACVDAGKVTDHHALLITGVQPGELSEPEQHIYRLVAGRMLETFGPRCEKETLAMEAEAGGLPFVSRSVTITSPGWRAVFSRQDEDAEDSDKDPEGEGDAVFEQGETAAIGGCSLATRKTKPRPLYTEATLLTAMECAGRDVADETAARAMHDCGLGTPATRAAIIATLFKREYITRKGRSLIPTEKGLFIYESVKNMRIADPQMTGEWERTLARIEAGEMPPETFMEAIKVYTRQVTSEILSLEFPRGGTGTFPCPKCGTGHVVLRQKVARCDNAACGLVIYRSQLNKELTDQHIQQLLSSGKTRLIKGFKGKKGNCFDAYVTLDKDYNTTLSFPPRESPAVRKPAAKRAKR